MISKRPRSARLLSPYRPRVHLPPSPLALRAAPCGDRRYCPRFVLRWPDAHPGRRQLDRTGAVGRRSFDDKRTPTRVNLELPMSAQRLELRLNAFSALVKHVDDRLGLV